MGPYEDDDERERTVSTREVVPSELAEALLRLCQGDFAHRLPRTQKRDAEDTIAFFFNAIAEELERIITTSRESEARLESTVGLLSDALVRVAAGDFENAQVERDFRGDALDVLVYLVNNTVTELSLLVAEKEKRAEADRERLERLVYEGTRKLDASEENLKRLFDVAPQPLVLLDVNALVVRRCNRRASDMLGAREEGLIGRRAAELFEDKDDRLALMDSLTRTGKVENFATKLVGEGGRAIWALVNATIVHDAEGPLCMVGFADLTEQKRIEGELREAATIDPLTGTLTRRRLFEIAEDEWARASRYDRPLCVAVLDLDHFKRVNDYFGHLVGDEALRRVGAALRTSVRYEDRVGRFGGEEFAVLLPETRLDDACGAVERLRAAVEAIDLQVPEGKVVLTMSAGIGVLRKGEVFEKTLERADEALYTAKSRGRNRVVVNDG